MAKLALVKDGSESLISMGQATMDSAVVEDSVQVENALLAESVEKTAAVTVSDIFSNTSVGTDAVNVLSVSNDDQCVVQNSLEQFFGILQKLATGGNLQELEQGAEKDLQALEVQLK